MYGATCVSQGCHTGLGQVGAPVYAIMLRYYEAGGTPACEQDPDLNKADPVYDAANGDSCGFVIDLNPTATYGRARCCCIGP